MTEQLGVAPAAPWPDGLAPPRARPTPAGWPLRPARHLLSTELANFAAIGVASTVLFALAYHVLRAWVPPLAANTLALTSTAGLNFAANRWLTFRSRPGRLLRQAWQYFVAYLFGLGVSTLALLTFLSLWRQPARDVELTAALLSSGLATAVRYVAMSRWVFRARGG
jgi:putative flippase GtrA